MIGSVTGKRAQKEAQAREREARTLDLRKAGRDFRAIGRELGITEAGAYKAFQRAISRLPGTEHRDELRALEAERLDQMQAATWQAAVAGNADAVETVLKIMARRARLLGLDAPVDVNLNLFIKLVSELRQLPEEDLLGVLGYANERLALPEHTDGEA